APGIRFELSPPGGTRETVRQTTLEYLTQAGAQAAVNAHFFLPFPSTDLNADLIGLAASNGQKISAFEAPVQSYAIVTNAPAINIDTDNPASLVFAASDTSLWNTFAGSAQIVTDSEKTIPVYKDDDHPDGLLTPGGPADYSNAKSWYDLLNARTAIGLTKDAQTLVIFTVDVRGGSLGMSVGEVAEMLIRDYSVYNALNMDGGGSTTLALRDPDSD